MKVPVLGRTSIFNFVPYVCIDLVAGCGDVTALTSIRIKLVPDLVVVAADVQSTIDTGLTAELSYVIMAIRIVG